MLCTLAEPTSGAARVSGFDVVSERDDVRRHIGLVFQDPTLDVRMTADAEPVAPRRAVRDRPRRHPGPDGPDARDGRPRRPARPARADVLRRHEAAPGDRPRAAALAARAVPRRADHRPGPADAQLDLALHPRTAGDGGDDDLHDHALHGRGGVLRPHRDHGPRRDRRPRHAGGAEGRGRRRPRGARHGRRRRGPGRAAGPLRHRGRGGRGRGDVPRRERRGVRPAAVRRARRRHHVGRRLAADAGRRLHALHGHDDPRRGDRRPWATTTGP